jgi:hypothetical protein
MKGLHVCSSFVEEEQILRKFEGAKPLSENNLPLPLDKGKGIKGIGLPHRDLNGVRVIKSLI